MKPCDCKKRRDVAELNESGVGYNLYKLYVEPPSVFIDVGPYARMSIPQRVFKRFAEWYLAEQQEELKKYEHSKF